MFSSCILAMDPLVKLFNELIVKIMDYVVTKITRFGICLSQPLDSIYIYDKKKEERESKKTQKAEDVKNSNLQIKIYARNNNECIRIIDRDPRLD